jgi:hypothetical protein
MLTVPLGNGYNSIAVILFVLYSLLAAKKENITFNKELLLPVLLFGLMLLSLSWSIDFKSSVKALGKEAALFFIPLAFCLNRHYTRKLASQILNNYSLGMCAYCLYFIIRAYVRYLGGEGTTVFFYHELATNAVNAIYLSALASPAMLWFLVKQHKSFWGYVAFLFLVGVIFLLSSKTIIIIDVLLIAGYYLFYSPLSTKAKVTSTVLFFVFVGIVGYNSMIKDRIEEEFSPNIVVQDDGGGLHNVTIHEAWTKPKFDGDDYFNGIAFRVYQIRIFKEMLQRDAIFFTGYGLNASLKKITEKGEEHNLYQSNDEQMTYSKMNFHNLYVEVFADLGIFGLLVLAAMVGVNLKNSFNSKDFIHIAFAILMIALFLTESFLWRQRGVVFFTIFYCLFNGILHKGAEKQIYEKNTHNGSSRLPGVASV